MKLVLRLAVCGLCVGFSAAKADVIYRSASGTDVLSYSTLYTVGPCYNGSCPTPTLTPTSQQQSYSTTIGGYNVPAGARINGATLTYSDYVANIVDQKNWAGWNSPCTGCDNVPIYHYSFENSVTLSTGMWSTLVPTAGTIDLLAFGFGPSLTNGQSLTLAGSHGIASYNNWSWYGYNGFTFQQSNTVTGTFNRYANLNLNYTPDPGAFVNAGSPLTAMYGSTIQLNGSAYHPWGYSFNTSWTGNNGISAVGLNPSIDLTGPMWDPGMYYLTLSATDNYGVTRSSMLALQVTSVPEPAAVALLGTVALLLFGRHRRARPGA
jgi:hypothetical protein